MPKSPNFCILEIVRMESSVQNYYHLTLDHKKKKTKHQYSRPPRFSYFDNLFLFSFCVVSCVVDLRIKNCIIQVVQKAPFPYLMTQALLGTTNSLPPPSLLHTIPLPTTSFILSLSSYLLSTSLHHTVLPSHSSQNRRLCFLPPASHFLLSSFNLSTSQSHHMAAIVCHGLQSHLETQIVESRTLRLRLPTSKPVSPQSIDLAFKSCFWDSNSNIKTHHHEENTHKTDTFQNKPVSTGGLSFLDALSNISQGTKEEPSSQKEATTYVHPQQKRSSLLLSPKSLELCTENLGNESGTDIAENGIAMFSSSSSDIDNIAEGDLGTREQRQLRQHFAAKKAKTMNFPPPLTTIRGSESLRVRPHREDGRLVIEVTKVPPSASCFQAERSHGRLRLCFLTNDTTSFDPQEEQEVVAENEPTPNEGFEEELIENEIINNGKIQDIEEEEAEEETEEEETKQEEGVACCECEEMKDSDVRMDKYERVRRCKEGGDRENNELLLNWGEPLWVATS